jgi:hypothetical protein
MGRQQAWEAGEARFAAYVDDPTSVIGHGSGGTVEGLLHRSAGG